MKRYTLLIIFLLLTGYSNSANEQLPAWKEPATGMEFVLIPAGSFYMGNPHSINDSPGYETLHFVTISHGFWMGTKEVTREQWEKVMGSEEPHPEKPNPFSKDNPQYPVVGKSYFDVLKFLEKLGQLSPGNMFRLPTEAEWEYACRAGTTTNYNFGDSISDKLANYNKQSLPLQPSPGSWGHLIPAAGYQPNAWGLYDMHGNAWEWTSDWYAPYPAGAVTDPRGPEYGEQKVIRGGSWAFAADNAKSYFRGTHYPDLWGYSMGFRVVRVKKN